MSDTLTTIGQIIDTPIEEVWQQIVDQQLNVGTINNIILLLERTYKELSERKDAIINLKNNGHISVEEFNNIMQTLYIELGKTEEKIVFLKEKARNLMYVN